MSTSLTERISTLEQKIARQDKTIARILATVKLKEFVPVAQAAETFNISVATLRDRIKHAKAFPKESPYKEGIHWKQVQTTARADGKEPSYRYYVNIEEWEKIS
ncbi:hypothetical protein V0288_11125 [Pannus brasiliensis CCIBt3594]|uniref:Uncharacterized protein n=1 Tax=Pannus brasiliensis CCIBt3594 TaxID=1427578 RepID=A0AAW9QUU5_9CHRO